MNENQPQRVLAIFDFDGTITYQDSLFEFLLFAVGKRKFFINFLKLFFTLIGFRFKLVSGNYAKEKVIIEFFKGWGIEDFNNVCSKFVRNKLPAMVKITAMDRIKWHKKLGHTVVVLSASLEHYLNPWCKEQDIDCIGTVLEVQGGKLSGKYEGENCYGPGKVIRLNERFSLNDFDVIYGYGNGKGDKEFLQLADHKFYRNFK